VGRKGGTEIATTLARRSAMTGPVVNPSMREKMERARRFFIERAGETRDADGALYEELGNLAEAVEEMASLLDHQKIQLEEVRQGIGHHLEVTGPVPHTRRVR
jgi:hypothetical protein